MYLLVNTWKFEFWVCKIAVNVVVIILNYLFSKLFIFTKGAKNTTESVSGREEKVLTEDEKSN